MNKVKLKKRIDSIKLKSLLDNQSFIGFFCSQNITVNERIQLRKDLDSKGFEYKLVKNAIVFKIILKALPAMKGILSGPVTICYAKDGGPVDFMALKSVFSILKKSKNTFFLGGLFEGILVNKLFETKVSSLNEIRSSNIEQISILQSILSNIIRTTSISKNKLSFLLSSKSN